MPEITMGKIETLRDNSYMMTMCIKGMVDGSVVRQVEQKLLFSLQQRAVHLILLFSDAMITSTGMGLLIKLLDKLKEFGGTILLVGLPKKVIMLFDMVGMLSLFKIFATEEEAIRSIMHAKKTTPDLLFQSKQEKLPDGSTFVTLRVFGTIDGATIHEFEKKMVGIFSQGIKNILLILAEVKYINSTGLGFLAKWADKFQGNDGSIKFVVPEKVTNLFNMLGVLSLFEVYETEEEAMRSNFSCSHGYIEYKKKSGKTNPELFQTKQEKLANGSVVVTISILKAVDEVSLENKIAEIFNQRIRNLVINLGEMSYVNNVTMDVLSKWADKFEKNGGDVKLVVQSTVAKKLMEV